MDITYITDSNGHDLPLTPERDFRAAFHFTQVGHVQNGIVWRCSEITGRVMRHRLTFTSYYNDQAARAWGMGKLLHHEMLAMEATARWEAELASHQLAIA